MPSQKKLGFCVGLTEEKRPTLKGGVISPDGFASKEPCYCGTRFPHRLRQHSGEGGEVVGLIQPPPGVPGGLGFFFGKADAFEEFFLEFKLGESGFRCVRARAGKSG